MASEKQASYSALEINDKVSLPVSSKGHASQ